MDYALQMLQEQRDSASKQKAAEIVQRVKQLHVDEISPGTKVSFVKKFSGDKEFTYLALKVDDEKAGQLWFVTGRERGLTNEKFEELLAEKLGFENFQRLATVPLDSIMASPQLKGWAGVPASPKYDTEGWGADVSPTGSAPVPAPPEPETWKGWAGAPSTHAVGPSEPGEESPA